jgi:tetratricopeptide (TPR) repeat protein
MERKGETDKALAIRERILGLKPKDGNAFIRLAETYQREGRIDDALDKYEQYARLLEDTHDDIEKLAQVYEKILAHRPDRKDLVLKVINISKLQGDDKKTLKWLEKGTALIEDIDDLQFLKATLYAKQNQSETARGIFMTLAEKFIEAGKVDEALNAFCEILVILPDEDDRLKGRVEAIRAGEMDKIVERSNRIRLERDAAELNEEEGESSQEGEPNDLDEVKGLIDDTQKEIVVPPISNKSASNRLSEAALRSELGKADASFNLADAYKKMGLGKEASLEYEKALPIYRRILAQDIDVDIISNKIAEIERYLDLDVEEKVELTQPVEVLVEKEEDNKKEASDGLKKTVKDKKKKKKISYI